jgi:hypothetical protein
MSIYASADDPAPDSEVEPGALTHLVVGNAGRLLDARRTPVSVVAVRPRVGMFVIRIDEFEDKGATWEIPFEGVDRYQFARGSVRADEPDVKRFREAMARFDRPLAVPCPEGAAESTARHLAESRRAAAAWLESSSRFAAECGVLPDPASRKGDPRLADDLGAFMAARGLGDVEDAFARRYVSNPDSGELVKGHRIVIAELGLVPYAGTVVRDPALFDGRWSKDRRAAHVLARLGFVRALFARLGLDHLTLYRGISTEGPLRPPRNRTFVSATFSREVAVSHYESGSAEAARALIGHAVPLERVFMTYHETPQMNDPFREAEAVLLYAADEPI